MKIKLSQFTPRKAEEDLITPTGASFVGQYPITLVHIVGFKMIKNRTNILKVLGGEGFKVGLGRVVYKD